MSDVPNTPRPEIFIVSWPVNNDRGEMSAYDVTPRKAVARARRLRRDFWLCGKDPGWLSLHEQLIWTRMKRRLG